MDNLIVIVLLISTCINTLLMYLLIKGKTTKIKKQRRKRKQSRTRKKTKKNLILFHLYMREYLDGLSADNCPYLHELNAIGRIHSELNLALTKVCSQIVLDNPQHTTPFPFVFKENITC